MRVVTAFKIFKPRKNSFNLKSTLLTQKVCSNSNEFDCFSKGVKGLNCNGNNKGRTHSVLKKSNEPPDQCFN